MRKVIFLKIEERHFLEKKVEKPSVNWYEYQILLSMFSRNSFRKKAAKMIEEIIENSCRFWKE